jgi:hypothetical protein
LGGNVVDLEVDGESGDSEASLLAKQIVVTISSPTGKVSVVSSSVLDYDRFEGGKGCCVLGINYLRILLKNEKDDNRLEKSAY